MINIRQATEHDVDVLFDLITAIARFHHQEEYVMTSKEEMLQSGFMENPRFGALIAEFEGQAVGYLSYTWNYSIWGGCEYMNLDDLFVMSEYRSKKVGNQLMQHAKSLCQQQNIGFIKWEVEKDNDKAIRFYKNLGAQMVEKGIFKWN